MIALHVMESESSIKFLNLDLFDLHIEHPSMCSALLMIVPKRTPAFETHCLMLLLHVGDHKNVFILHAQTAEGEAVPAATLYHYLLWR